jgi:hypothetical protein
MYHVSLKSGFFGLLSFGNNFSKIGYVILSEAFEKEGAPLITMRLLEAMVLLDWKLVDFLGEG